MMTSSRNSTGSVDRRLASLVAAAFCVAATVGAVTGAEDPPSGAHWSFEEALRSATAHDTVGHIDDLISGQFERVPGIAGKALRFDGYTTVVKRAGTPAGAPDAGKIPLLRHAFTLSAWVALDAYPWNWAPIIDNANPGETGYFFGIDAFGHVGLQMAVDHRWVAVTSQERLPLKRWVQLSAVFDGDRGILLYVDGKMVAELPVRGNLTPEDKTALLIGRVRRPMLHAPTDTSIEPLDPVMYSIQGLLDEIEIRATALAADEIQKMYAAMNVPPGEVLPWTKMPSGPAGPGTFGAYATTLRYDSMWDRMRRMGPDTDVVVRFDESPVQLVFWQGTNYVPTWRTENGKWYAHGWLEAYGKPAVATGDCEVLSDKQTRFSHVSIVESNDARAVVHWRYALCTARDYEGAFTDPDTGWFDWADEYWTIYPDGVAVRKQTLWSSELRQLEPWIHEWEESDILLEAGERPEDSIELDALTLANMRGESATYHWEAKAPDDFDFPHGPASFPKPENPNIQLVNLKSRFRPFEIVPPENAHVVPYNGEKSFSTFCWWNHWPVAQIRSSGRSAILPDRPSCAALSHFSWEPSEVTERNASKLLLCGLTEKRAADLVPLAASWLRPPAFEVVGVGAHTVGFDQSQRAFVVSRERPDEKLGVTITFHANPEKPLINPAVLIHGWTGDAQVLVDGAVLPPGKGLRIAKVQRLAGTDLLVWLEMQAQQPVVFKIIPQ